MNSLAIVCFSCDKNEELWPTFMACLNKYWQNHPTTYLLTETLNSPLMHTINYNYDLNNWSTRIYESLKNIPEEKIIFICDDCFLDSYVNLNKLQEALQILQGNIACINFELSFDPTDLDSEYPGFKKKDKNSLFLLSLLCGLWNKEKLMELLKDKNCNPWQIEEIKDIKDYDIYEVATEKILSWFRDGPCEFAASFRGKWSKDLPAFLEKEKIKMDLSKKGFY